MLIRPIAIGLGRSWPCALMLGQSPTRAVRVRIAVLLLAGSLLAVLPWQVWIYVRTGRTVTLSTGGAIGVRDGLDLAVGGADYRADDAVPRGVRESSRDVLERRANQTPQSEFAVIL